MEDGEIVELFFARSEEAIAALAEKYGPLCGSIAKNLLGDRRDAEECLNDAWLAVWNTVPPQRPEPLSGYVCRIVRNLAVKRFHANTARKRNGSYDMALEELAECFPAAGSAEEAAEAGEAAETVNAFLAGLDESSRILFVRRYWYADSIEALAARFHTGRHNVSVRLSRIRKALKKYLAKEGIGL